MDSQVISHWRTVLITLSIPPSFFSLPYPEPPTHTHTHLSQVISSTTGHLVRPSPPHTCLRSSVAPLDTWSAPNTSSSATVPPMQTRMRANICCRLMLNSSSRPTCRGHGCKCGVWTRGSQSFRCGQ